jgi:hypothetical protein
MIVILLNTPPPPLFLGGGEAFGGLVIRKSTKIINTLATISYVKLR